MGPRNCGGGGEGAITKAGLLPWGMIVRHIYCFQVGTIYANCALTMRKIWLCGTRKNCYKTCCWLSLVMSIAFLSHPSLLLYNCDFVWCAVWTVHSYNTCIVVIPAQLPAMQCPIFYYTAVTSLTFFYWTHSKFKKQENRETTVLESIKSSVKSTGVKVAGAWIDHISIA